MKNRFLNQNVLHTLSALLFDAAPTGKNGSAAAVAAGGGCRISVSLRVLYVSLSCLLGK